MVRPKDLRALIMPKKTAKKNCIGCQAELEIDFAQCPYCKSAQLTRGEIVLQRLGKAVIPTASPATRMLLFLNILLFVVLTIDILLHPDFTLQDALFTPPAEIVLRWGAQIKGELVWWRVFTANFAHLGLVHILFNMMALRYVGPYVERTFGAPVTFGAFVFLGAASMTASNLIGDAGIVVAGASGAIMALIAMAGIAAHREHTPLSLKIRNSMLTAAAATVGFGILVNGSIAKSMGHGIDNIAHIAGLVVGLIAGLILPRLNATGFTKRWQYRLSYALCLGSLAVIIPAFCTLGIVGGNEKSQRECEQNLLIKNYDQALTSCKTAFDADNNNPNAWRNYILVNALRKDYKTANTLCKRADEQFASQKEDNRPLPFTMLCDQIRF